MSGTATSPLLFSELLEPFLRHLGGPAVRFERNGLLPVTTGGVRIPQRPVHLAPVDVSVRVVGPQLDGVVEVRQRLRVLRLPDPHQPAVEPRARAGGVHLYGAGAVRDRLLVMLSLVVGAGAREPRRHEVRAGLQGPGSPLYLLERGLQGLHLQAKPLGLPPQAPAPPPPEN